MRAGFVFAAVCLSVAAMSARAETPAAPPIFLVEDMGNARDQYVSSHLEPFAVYSGADRALDEDDIARLRQVDAARQRAAAAMPFFTGDLDADGRMTLDEYKLANLYESRNEAELGMKARFANFDRNGDGIVTLDEALKSPPLPRMPLAYGLSDTERVAALLAIDPNKDGKLTEDEFKALLLSAFAFYDKNGDGALSKAEKTERAATVRQFREEQEKWEKP
ncbi:EF-hand domain-containing protein [Rhizobium sp. CC1099]|uniref:EF-hand domain-containing protein n=1 Tax=Rhizobium sp. CC1099 TaxID=3039160 RepID=UPI0024B1D3D4|nr:EF-hand domain-containing protein [Rhizobium sp. CC1099]WFU88210.1 EF-hand domain-containing protein [Rhizobium sp. CC1099]